MVPAVFIDRPVGRPDSDHVKLVSRSVSVAVAVRAVMAVPDGLAWWPGLVTDTEPVTVQVKLATPMTPEASVALRVTRKSPDVVGMPVMMPVPASIDRPSGRPGADQVKVASLGVSVSV